MPPPERIPEAGAARVAAALERRALLAASLGEGLRLGFLGLTGLGTLALLLRATLELPSAEAALALTPLALVPMLAFWRAWSRRPSRSALVAWLDARAGGDGAVVTDLEEPDARWAARAREHAERVPLPALDVRPEGLRLLVGASFCAAALLVPLHRAPAPGPPTSLFLSTLERLEERLSLLRELGLEREPADELAARLGRAAEELAAGSPEAAFESLDRLSARLGGEGARLAERLQAVGSSLAAESEPEALGRLLSETLSGLEGSPLLERLPEELRALAAAAPLLSGAGLEPARMLQLSAGLRELLGENLLELSDAGLLDPARLRESLEALRATVVEHQCDETCEPGGT